MDLEGDEAGRPKFEILTTEGRGRSSRGYTGPGIATYLVDEEGSTEKFSGYYVGGIRQGRGEYEFMDGSKFNGIYENNKKNGIGDATYKIKEIAEEGGEPRVVGEARYLGHFVGGQRQTFGCMKYPNGDTYSGEWLAGQKHGEGSYRFSADGSVLSGYWEYGSLKRGRWFLPTGAVYVGEFELNKPSGQGAWLLPGGRQILVEYTQQKREIVDQSGTEEGGADEEEGNKKYEIDKIEMRCICSVNTRE